MIYKLYFDRILFGSINLVSQDFLAFCGAFVCDLERSDKLSEQLLEYISISKLLSAFYAKEGSVNTDEESDLVKKENEFSFLIESNNWKLEEEDGQVTKILIPVFHDEEVTWRLRTN